ELFKAAVEGGADAIKIHFNVHHCASGMTFGSVHDYRNLLQQWKGMYSGPIGAVIGDSVEKVTEYDIRILIEEGMDYVSLYAHHAPAWLATQRAISKMIAFGPDYTSENLSAIHSI